MKKLFKRKKSKLATIAKVLVPVAGAIAAKKLWDNKGALLTDNIRTKILEKTEAVQDKVQQFHDLVQNSSEESVENAFVDEDTEETIFVNENIEESTETEEKIDVADETPAEHAENTEDAEKTES